MTGLRPHARHREQPRTDGRLLVHAEHLARDVGAVALALEQPPVGSVLDLAAERPHEPRQRGRLLLQEAPVAVEPEVQRARRELLARPPVREALRQRPQGDAEDPLRHVAVPVPRHHLRRIERLGEGELLVVVPGAVAPRERDLLHEHAELGVEHPRLRNDVLRPAGKARTPEADDRVPGRVVGPRVRLEAGGRRAGREPARVHLGDLAGGDGVDDRRAVERPARAEEQARPVARHEPVADRGKTVDGRDETHERARRGASRIDREMDEADRRGRSVDAPDERLLLVPDSRAVDVRGLEDRQVAVGEPRRRQAPQAGAVPLVAGRPDRDGQARAADAPRDDLAPVGDVERGRRAVDAEREPEREVVDAGRGQRAPAAPLRVEERLEIAARPLVRRPVRRGEQPGPPEIALGEQRPPHAPRVRRPRLRSGARGGSRCRPGRSAADEADHRAGRQQSHEREPSSHDNCHSHGEGRYMPIAWYPASTYSVVPVTFFASSERR